jgi:hypothetical protein
MLPKEIASKEKKTLEELEEILTRDLFVLILEKIRDKELSEDRIKEV